MQLSKSGELTLLMHLCRKSAVIRWSHIMRSQHVQHCHFFFSNAERAHRFVEMCALFTTWINYRSDMDLGIHMAWFGCTARDCHSHTWKSNSKNFVYCIKYHAWNRTTFFVCAVVHRMEMQKKKINNELQIKAWWI